MEFLIIFLFLAFAFLDALAQLPKHIGGAMSLGGVAFTVSNIMHTVKRLFVVSYPPVIAIYLLSAGLESLFRIIFICYFGAAAIAGLVFIKKDVFQKLLARQIYAFGSGGSLWKPWKWGEVPDFAVNAPDNSDGKIVEVRLFLSALWIHFFFGSVYFLINVLGYTFKEYSSVILQLTGFVNAMGTLILAFYLDPVLARVFERDRERADVALRSVLLAQIVNFGIVSPVFFFILSFFLFK